MSVPSEKLLPKSVANQEDREPSSQAVAPKISAEKFNKEATYRLEWACRLGGDLPKVRLALEQNADISGKAPISINDCSIPVMSPLHWAAGSHPSKSTELVELLLSHQAAINALDVCGNSPLFLAKNHRNDEIAALLVSRGAQEIAYHKLIPSHQPEPIARTTASASLHFAKQ
jgi:ankyrin repeat protein